MQSTDPNNSTSDAPLLASLIDALAELRKQGLQVMLIMRGVPGAGKSTAVREIVQYFPQVAVCSADHFFEKSGEYVFDFTKLKDAHAASQQKAAQAMQDGVPLVAIDNTCVKPWEYKKYEEMADAAGYKVLLVEFRCRDPINNVDLSHLLAARNSHGVPQEKILEMLGNFQEDQRSIQMPIAGLERKHLQPLTIEENRELIMGYIQSVLTRVDLGTPIQPDTQREIDADTILQMQKEIDALYASKAVQSAKQHERDVKARNQKREKLIANLASGSFTQRAIENMTNQLDGLNVATVDPVQSLDHAKEQVGLPMLEAEQTRRLENFGIVVTSGCENPGERFEVDAARCLRTMCEELACGMSLPELKFVRNFRIKPQKGTPSGTKLELDFAICLPGLHPEDPLKVVLVFEFKWSARDALLDMERVAKLVNHLTCRQGEAVPDYGSLTLDNETLRVALENIVYIADKEKAGDLTGHGLHTTHDATFMRAKARSALTEGDNRPTVAMENTFEALGKLCEQGRFLLLDVPPVDDDCIDMYSMDSDPFAEVTEAGYTYPSCDEYEAEF